MEGICVGPPSTQVKKRVSAAGKIPFTCTVGATTLAVADGIAGLHNQNGAFGMTNRLLVGVGIAAVVAAAALLWRFKQQPAPEEAPAPPVASAPAPAPAASAASAPQPEKPPLEVPVAAAPLAPQDIPQELTELVGRKAVASFLQLDDFPRRFVATVDNLGRAHAPPALWPVNPTPDSVPGRRARRRPGDSAADNAARYTPFVLLVETVSVGRAVDLYVRMYPLLQRGYEELGYPNRYFNDRMIEVIDLLLATPDVEYPVKVELTDVKGPIPSVRPWVRYEFSDPALEALTSGQKILVRSGAVNQRRLKGKLAELRAELVEARRQALKAADARKFPGGRRTGLADRHRAGLAGRRAGPSLVDTAHQHLRADRVRAGARATGLAAARRRHRRHGHAAGQRRLRADPVRVRLSHQPALAAHQSVARRHRRCSKRRSRSPRCTVAVRLFGMSMLSRAAAGVAVDVHLARRR